MVDDPAYGPLCPKLAALQRAADSARLDVARCAEQEANCLSVRDRLDSLVEQVSYCEARLTGVSYGAAVCCPHQSADVDRSV